MAEKKTRKVQKGGFAIMEEIQGEGEIITYKMLARDKSIMLAKDSPTKEIDLQDTASCLKWIRENAKDLKDKNVVIVQVKRRLVVGIEQVQKVRLDIR